VELAQLRYRLSRLAGLGRSMSRLGGGIGTRGPGEKKLEMDRRLIKDRISQLKQELREVEQHRAVNRAKRERNQLPVVAIIGYTNAGKSTLLNHLTDAQVLEEDKLFATLDPTTRSLELSGKQQVLLTDTVGFIRKLPHHLIEAFKSTLEEAKYADYIFHVVDASNPQRDKQMHITYQTLDDLGIKDKTIVTLFNKQDLRTDSEPLKDFRADRVLSISAALDQGLEELKALLEELLREDKIYIERVIPYAKAGDIQMIRKQGELLSEEYVPEGIAVKAYVPMEVYGRLD
jgi:GTP-binding protein HflX